MSHFHGPALPGGVCLLIWLYLLLGRGQFWRLRTQRVPTSTHARVVAIVPARNEAAVVARSVRSLLDQTAVSLEVILVDDHSSDGTANFAREAAAGKENRLTIIAGSPLPPGWSGKVWALQQGIDAAGDRSPDYFLLTDADIEHSPGNVSTLVTIAKRGAYDLASYMAKLHCKTVPERLLIPAFVYFFFQLYPPKWIANPDRATAGAAGGCILIRPEALQLAGAMHSIRGKIIDDCALARAVKCSGGTVWLGPTETARSIRPYNTFAEIERMIARTAFNQLQHSSLLLVFAVLSLLVTYLVPVILLFGPWWPLGLTSLVLMTVTYWPMIRFYRLNPLWVLTLPAAAIFYLAATIDSAFRYWLGRGGEWKGRSQDRQPSASRSPQ